MSRNVNEGPQVVLKPGHEVDILGTDYVLVNRGSITITMGLVFRPEQELKPHGKGSGAHAELGAGQELWVPESRLAVRNVGPLVAKVQLLSKTWRRQKEKEDFARRAVKEANLGSNQRFKKGRYANE